MGVSMLLELLCYDLRMIVYQYVHRSMYERLIGQYNDTIRKYWNDDDVSFGIYFGQDDDNNIVLNYRKLHNVEDYENAPIFRLTDVRTDCYLPDNYCYTGYWWPVPLHKQLVTHERLK